MSEKPTNHHKKNLLTRIDQFLVALLFLIIPVTGLVLESLNIHIIGFEMVGALYLLAVAVSCLVKQWKLVVLATIGSMVIWAITIGLSEVLWYYAKEWFNIDISYR
ncbi:hypothetical protein [Streptococcus cuniculi]|uniref:Uncharacterized protein n=1 Tax=Streptococcus cuniculi TaxID=1432788 RepID=A0A4Y9JAZ0_9STRE|nr:hypothetical protein [Streptococcus cuniculi]MBF0778939.1 hypothetical protein [Streptococcus cuniculi]TFU97094.1 hypothetical protein E4T82_09435 [Streptococcus cuniculi]